MKKIILLFFAIVMFAFISAYAAPQTDSLQTFTLPPASFTHHTISSYLNLLTPTSTPQNESLPSQFTQPITAQSTSTGEQSLTTVAQQASPAVVSIVVTKRLPQYEIIYFNPFGENSTFDEFDIGIPIYRQTDSTLRQIGAGTGFIIASNGYILTNKHVVGDQDALYTVVLNDGTQMNGSVVYRDPTNDIALMKVEGSGFSAIPLGTSSNVQIGTNIVAIGNALGQYSNTISAGIISGLNRTIIATDPVTDEEVELEGVIQTDAAINPGNSGGPLLNLYGQVIGITTAYVVGSNNISFSIPIDEAKEAISQYIQSS